MSDIVSGRYPVDNEGVLLSGKLAQLGNAAVPVRSSVDRRFVSADVAAALTTQVITAVAVPLQLGDVVTKIAVKSGATAMATPTNWWFALYDDSTVPALLAQTADQLTAAWGANTTQDLALSAPMTITRSGVYYVGIMVKAATVPSLPCKVLPVAGVSSGVLTGEKTLALTSGASLTTTAPATLATPTPVVNVPLVVCH